MNKNIIRKFLDKLFCLKRLSLYLPLALSLLMLLLGALLCDWEENAFVSVVSGVLISAVWFAFTYSLTRLPARLKNCPDWYTDSFELFLTLAFTLSAILQIVKFIGDFGSFSISVCFALVSLGAVSLAHNKRN